MNYELAKQLKDAGFPQKEPNDVSAFVAGRVYIPTLSELIEAIVGDKPNSFYLEYNDNWAVYDEPNPKGMWKARYYDITPVGFYECFADTLIEAVAKLWLALNKK